MATRWQSNDNRIWTFTLRDDAKWSDGTPVTAQDFVYSWQRLVDPKTTSPFAWLLLWQALTTLRRLLMAKPRPIRWGSGGGCQNVTRSAR
ncbi:putative transport periplasmic protein [Enterobacter cloacae]|uniref:Putative transport periplasmic protein n=1 Tax=Enterobacter cloacae TaxID=550 RepID=A0A377M0I7_ENTCL|nr:putative transport periplasmic protein [Enterobacter cloacae]